MNEILKEDNRDKLIKKSEEIYKNLFDTSTDGIVHSDLDGNFLGANKAFLNMIGYSLEEIKQLNYQQITPLKWHEFERQEALNFIKSGQESFELEKEFIRKDNTIFPASVKLWTSKDIKGEQKRIWAIIRDISERKIVEQKLKKSEERFRSLVESSSDWIWEVNQNSVYTYSSPKIRDVLGYKPEDIIGKTPFDLMPSDEAQRVSEIFSNIITSQKPFNNLENKNIHKDGRVLMLETSGMPIFDIDGKFQGYRGVNRDITHHKQAEQELKESEEKYRNITEQSLMGICILQNDEIKYVNKRYADICGYPVEEMKSWKPKEFIKAIHPEDREFVVEQARKKQLNLPDVKKHYHFRGITKTGQTLWVDNFAKSIIYEGKPADLITIIDITEQKKAEHKLKESEEKYRSFIENSPDIIMIVDHKGTMQYINRVVPPFTIEGSIGKNIYMYINQEYKDEHKKILRNVFQTGRVQEINIKGVGPDNSVSWYETRLAPIKYEEKVVLVMIISTDITQRMNAEQKLKESENRYRKIIENTKEGYFEVDLKGSFTFFNPALSGLLGYTPEELLGVNYMSYMTKEGSGKSFKVFNNVYKTEISFKDFQYEIIRKNGNKIYGESSVYLRYDSEGNKIGFSGFMRDITEKKDAVQKLKKKNIELSALNKIIALGNESQSLEEFLEKSYDQVLDSVSFDKGGIYLYNPQTQHNTLIHHKNIHPDFIAAVEDVDMTEGFFGRVFNKSKPFYVDNFSEILEGSKELGVYSVVIVPLRSKDEYVGSMNVASSVHQHLTQDELELLVAIGKQMGIIIQKFESETQLKQSEEKYKSMIDDLDLGFYQIKWDGTILNVNPAFKKIMGINPSETIDTIKQLNFWKTLEDQNTFLRDLMKNNYVEDYILIGQNSYNQDLALELHTHLIRDENANPLIIEGTIADITAKFKLEQKLKSSEERYRFIFENSPLAIILVDSNGIIREINPATEKLIGFKKIELIGRTITNLSILSPHYLALVLKQLKLSFEGLPQPSIDIQAYKKEGGSIWINITSTIIKIGENTFLQVIGHNITDRKKAELLIMEEIEKLKELDQIRKDLISRVSHELKTPLIPILGGAELLLTVYKKQLESEPLELVELIEKGGNRLSKLIDRLLDVTRIEYNKLELEKQNTNLSDLLLETTKDMSYLIKKREIDLNLVVPNNIYLKIDRIRIEQVITNLLSNAVKNTPPKGRISLVLEKYKNWAIISVSDTGVGFTEEEMKIIFTRFGKIERYGEGLEYIDMKGSGLGLYIAKQIVDLHNGKIWVESTGRNKGCIFKIRLSIK